MRIRESFRNMIHVCLNALRSIPAMVIITDEFSLSMEAKWMLCQNFSCIPIIDEKAIVLCYLHSHFFIGSIVCAEGNSVSIGLIPV